MDGDKGSAEVADVTELPERGKYNHLPEDTVTSNMVGRKGEENDEKNSPEGGKLLTEDGAVATEVKFISAADDTHNGDANVSIEAVKTAFAGMGKEELMKFANDPFWIRLRWFLFALFWLIWAAMLAVAIVIIVMAPKCAAPAPKIWWEQSPLYQIHVPSFKEGEGSQSGVGNLKGIREKLDYLSDLGVQAVAISPIMKTANGAVENFIDIDPQYGTFEDFKTLTTEMKEKGMHLVMSFIPNHSSSKHPWFQKSIKKEDPYTNYYVWADKKEVDINGHSVPPNNWMSTYNGSAWEWNSERNAFYLHQFGKDEPDLNFNEPAVIKEFQNIMQFWMDYGAEGFILDKVKYLLEDETLTDEAINPSAQGKVHDEYGFLNNHRTTNQPGVVDVLEKFKEIIRNNSETGVLAVADNVDSDTLREYYGQGSEVVVDLPFNHFPLSSLNSDITASSLYSSIFDWLSKTPNNTWTNWEIGSPSSSRLATRVSPGMLDGIHMSYMLLNGTIITLYGDELGMEDVVQNGPVDSKHHPSLGLMQWKNSTNGGFSEAPSTWIEASDSYAYNNVERQINSVESHCKVFKALVEARKSPSIMYGSTEAHIVNDTVLAYTRVKSGSPGFLVLFNLGDPVTNVDLSPFTDIPDELTVLIRSVGFSDDGVQIKNRLKPDAISLAKYDALVLTYVPKSKE
ncbi:hypothetical protein J437_LFUL003571 [Ladona fulva]|uniref:alpha-glucosidase n=1 Tax=Ladona fulva TaxID=123851 RepID=A0A8K0NSN3_LADFU|nr:hypothetical protein J437_LFUL003571 [Ladona fulva]